MSRLYERRARLYSEYEPAMEQIFKIEFTKRADSTYLVEQVLNTSR